MTTTKVTTIQSNLSTKHRKQIQLTAKSTPWYNTMEFEQVGQSLLCAATLFSSSSSSSRTSKKRRRQEEEVDERIQNIQSAIQRVALWRTRVDQGRLPLSIESTSNLAEVMLNDYTTTTQTNSSSRSSSSYTTMSLRLAYASVIIRGVNGIADSIQRNTSFNNNSSNDNNNYYTNSVSNLCDRIGLPTWVVDLRHDASHNDLPSLQALRLASCTLLGFLGNVYWGVHERLGWEVSGKAVYLLGLYKQSVKAWMSGKDGKKALEALKIKEEEVEEEEEEEENDDDDADDNEEEDEEEVEMEHVDDDMWFARIKKEDEKSTTSETKEDKKETAQTNSPSQPSVDKTNPSNMQEKQQDDKDVFLPSPKECAQEYITTIPIDSGIQILLSYFIHGVDDGTTTTYANRGAFIPGSITSFPMHKDESIWKYQLRWSMLLHTVCTAWTGFAYALLVNIVDYILVLEEEEEGDYSEEEAMKQAGRDRKLHFLSSWVKYLVSREFHSIFDSTLALFPHDDANNNKNASAGDGSKIDLLRKRKRCRQWTRKEREFMSQSAPFTSLKRARLPLMSLCGRLRQVITTDVGCDDARTRTTSKSLLALFTNIIETPSMVVEDEEGRIKHSSSQTDNQRKETKSNDDKDDECKLINKTNATSDEEDSPIKQTKSMMMSLEDMEALLTDSDSDNGDDDDDDDETKITNISKENSIDDDDGDGKQLKISKGQDDPVNYSAAVATNTTTAKMKETQISAWTLCDSWEECAIGTLPGYPS